MGMLLKLAWRNMFRNKRRTFLSGLAVGMGLASMIFVFGVYDGMLKSMIRTATDSFLGEGQIHALGFRDTNEVELTIKDFQGVMQSLEMEEVIERFTPRTITIGMLTSPSDVATALVYGIDPVSEPPLSRLDEAMREGKYLQNDDLRGILVGSKAAENLEIGIGDRVVLTAARAGTGELAQELFRVRGIFHYDIKEADSGMMYIHIDKAREMLGIGPTAHEIALKFTDIELAGDRSLPFWTRCTTGGNEALGWNDIVPQLDSVVAMTDIGAFIIGILVFCIVALTIMNTLFMSLYERMYEFGVLRAIGTRPLSMAGLILFEALLLGVVSSIIGAALGLLLTGYFNIYGIDYRGIEFASVTFTELLYPTIIPRHYLTVPLLILGFAGIAALYPAWFAARLKPAETMRRSL
ncbi:MAG: ABC transporter permease [Proteobacteria bacterium]|nr:ABC transporter permease [Pseudomonadota bacterium]MBU1738033.1 ABC transporter permease [Pseudomonadota bacterium]